MSQPQSTVVPPPGQPLSGVPKKIVIEPVLNGYKVSVGCQVLVFHNRGSLMDQLDRYLMDPRGMEQHYQDHALHRDMMNLPMMNQPMTGDGRVGYGSTQDTLPILSNPLPGNPNP